jgi:sugar phosphate isomerase/epimerase
MSFAESRRFSRRDIARFGGGALAAACGGLLSPLSARQKVPIALQLYSVRADCQKDLPGTLAAVARMGYQGVEFADYYGRGAKELRRMLDANGLKAVSTHIMLDEMMGDKLGPTIEFNQVLGNPRLTLRWVSPTKTIQPWYDVARSLNEIAGKLKPHGMNVGFHNHPHELVPVEGKLPLDVILDNTSKDVTMQLDLGSVMKSGADPIAYLKRYPGRARTMHVKDYSPSNDKPLIGEGVMNFKEIFRLAETIGGVEWYIVEQETYPYPPMESVERSLKAMRSMGK